MYILADKFENLLIQSMAYTRMGVHYYYSLKHYYNTEECLIFIYFTVFIVFIYLIDML